VAQRPLTAAALSGVALLAAALTTGGCGGRPASPAGGATPVYRVGQEWPAPPGWRLAVTGMRCGAAAALGQTDPDTEDVCLVAVAFSNTDDRSRPFPGTGERPGPAWRLVGYDAAGGEFHGHELPAGDGRVEVAFPVPAGGRLTRVLIGDATVDLSAAGAGGASPTG
jgi:hypothetical protein